MNDTLTARQARLADEFHTRFSSLPDLIARAPGRVDLMGSHTDYNQGHVLTLAIEPDTWIAARRRADRRVVLHSLNLPGVSVFDLDRIQALPAGSPTVWENYVRGVAQVLQQAGHRLTGFDGVIHSTIPLRSGLSSSAALEVATARLFDRLDQLGLDPVTLARLCQRAENEFVGMNCGILDQYTSSVGQVGSALLLDCRSLTSSPVVIPERFSIVICDTCSHRELTGSEYPERRSACEAGARSLAEAYPAVTALRDVSLEMLYSRQAALPEVVFKRAHFIIEEEQRVLDLAAALAGGDAQGIAVLTQASFAGARDLYEITTHEMERMHAAMLAAPGVIGARQAGAGFGGCLVAFVARECVDAFCQAVSRSYQAAVGITPQVYPVA
ncbi:MAG: galactokinase [Chloroflexota bacterium]